MKIIIEFNANDLPEPYKTDGPEGDAGRHNLLHFLVTQLYHDVRDKQVDQMCKKDYTKAFFDQQKKGSGQGWVDALAKVHEDAVSLGTLLTENLRIEE